MKIIITEEQLGLIKDKKFYFENNSCEIFNKEVRNFIYNLMKGELNDISDYWLINGVKRSELYSKLIRNRIIKIGDEEEILTPKRNFDKLVNRLYYELFPEQEPGLLISEDDGCGISDGATSSMGSGSYEAPVFGKPIRRNFTNTVK